MLDRSARGLSLVDLAIQVAKLSLRQLSPERR
jgi:hypothetical protein